MLRSRSKPVRRRLPLRPASLRARRNPVRKPGVLGTLGWLDQRVLRAMRTRGHAPPVEAVMKTLGTAGEYAAVWIAIGASGAAGDPGRRRRWAIATAVGPAAVGINYAVKLTVGRERPLIEEHPPLARAPSKLSFPSAHSTSSMAAATALGRVEPRARVPLYLLAGGICMSRPYLGMHYPSDVLAGAALGVVLGALAPGLRGPGVEDRMIDLVAERGAPAAPPAAATATAPPTDAEGAG